MRIKYNKTFGMWFYILLVLFIGWQSMYIDTASMGLPIIGAFYWPIIGLIAIPYVGIVLLPLSVLYVFFLVVALRYLIETILSKDVPRILLVVTPLIVALLIRHASAVPGMSSIIS